MMPPGAKLGLSNLATMYAAGSLGLPSAPVFGGVQRCVRLGGPGGACRADEPLRRGVSTVVMWLLLKKANASLGVVWRLRGPGPQRRPAVRGLLPHRHQRGLLRALPGAVRRAHRAADRACAQADAEALGAAAKHPEVKLFSRTQKHLPRAARLRRCFFKLLFSF